MLTIIFKLYQLDSSSQTQVSINIWTNVPDRFQVNILFTSQLTPSSNLYNWHYLDFSFLKFVKFILFFLVFSFFYINYFPFLFCFDCSFLVHFYLYLSITCDVHCYSEFNEFLWLFTFRFHYFDSVFWYHNILSLLMDHLDEIHREIVLKWSKQDKCELLNY